MCVYVCVVLSSLIRRRISLIRIYQKLVIFEETSPTFSRGACQLGGGDITSCQPARQVLADERRVCQNAAEPAPQARYGKLLLL